MIDLGKNLEDYKNNKKVLENAKKNRRYRPARQYPRCFLIDTTQIEETFLYHTNVTY